jgi:2-isopropylmalate synthase
LPIDPADVGRSYDAAIRVNSQSGTGGVAWVLEEVELSRAVQRRSEESGTELSAREIVELYPAIQ